MKEHPILFSTKMVQALLEGRKTQTRRIIKQAKGWDINWKVVPVKEEHLDGIQRYEMRCGTQYSLSFFKAKFNVGDILWVRETWNTLSEYVRKPDYSVMSNDDFVYKANEDRIDKWKPSIFMPRSACRIRLKITDIRVERLQDISEADAIAEGAEPALETAGGNFLEYIDKSHVFYNFAPFKFRTGYKKLWSKINGQKSWDENPFVWVIEFKKL